MKSNKKTKLCFVASGGGHLRQLLQLSPLYKEFSYYFITEKTPLGEYLCDQHQTLFVPHFAFGQRRTKGWFFFLFSGIKNLLISTWLFIKERPDIIISTGAGAAFFTLLWGYIFRKKIIYIESIARVTKVSLFGTLAARFTGLCIVQWPGLIKELKGAQYCSPLVVKDIENDSEREGILITVGTVMPFDRMVSGVSLLKKEGRLSGPIVAQIGNSKTKFEGIDAFESCSFAELNERMNIADIVICHGGSGSILGALKAGCHVIAMARKHEYGEHYDNHQTDITNAFWEMGLISVAKDENDLWRAIEEARGKERKIVEIDSSHYLAAIREFILGIKSRRNYAHSQPIKTLE